MANRVTEADLLDALMADVAPTAPPGEGWVLGSVLRERMGLHASHFRDVVREKANAGVWEVWRQYKNSAPWIRKRVSPPER